MRAASRNIAPATAFARQIPLARMENLILQENAGLEDTLRELPGLIHKNLPQTRAIAQRLKGRNLRETCRNIWQFIYDHVDYREDPEGTEQIRSFSRLMADRVGDCDCYVNSVSAILLNLGIPNVLRVTKYGGDKFQHIYVIVPHGRGKYYTIDPVVDQFDFEVPFSEHIDLPMTLEYLNGITPTAGPDMILNGKTTKGTMKAQEDAQKAAQMGISLEEYKRREREAFIAQHGVTPEEFAQRIRNQVEQGQAQNQARLAEEIARMKAELTRRKVSFPANASHAQLLQLLNANPRHNLLADAARKANMINPAAIALRTGLLIAMKGNLMKIAEMIRKGILSQAEAQRKGIPRIKWEGYRKAWNKLKQIHHMAGGDVAKLEAAIRSGKGNRDGLLPRTGSLSGVELGEIATATALAAAMATLKIIQAILQKIEQGKAEGRSGLDTTAEILQTISDGKNQITQALDPEVQKEIERIQAEQPDLLPDVLPGYEPGNLPGPAGPVHSGPQSAERMEKEPGFLKKHGWKLLLGGAGIGVVALVAKSAGSGKKKSGSLSGTPKKRTATRKTTTPKSKGTTSRRKSTSTKRKTTSPKRKSTGRKTPVRRKTTATRAKKAPEYLMNLSLSD